MKAPSSMHNTELEDAETASGSAIGDQVPVLTSHGVVPESRAATIESLSERIEHLEEQIEGRADPSSAEGTVPGSKAVRIRSERTLFGYPIYDIAFGPDPQNGIRKGHARGIFALGDRATGVVAIGGLAQGVIAIGGLSWGLFSVGGCTVGLIAGVGGVAVGGIVLGGVAVGVQAFGPIAMSALPSLAAMFSSGSPSA